MKPVFIIAIVAVVMIGVMVPSSFAGNDEIKITTVEGSGLGVACVADGCYTPTTATVDVGGIVTMTNTDSTGVHTFTSGTVDGFTPQPDGTFESGVLMSGDSFQWQANVSGEVPYYCMLHTWMVGTITVGGTEKISNSSQVSGVIKLDKNSFSLSKYTNTMLTISGTVDSDSREMFDIIISKDGENLVELELKLPRTGEFSTPIILDSKFTPGTYVVIGKFHDKIFDERTFEILNDSSKLQENNSNDNTENIIQEDKVNNLENSNNNESISVSNTKSYSNEFSEVTIKKITTEKLENSNLIRINFDFKNLSNEEMNLYWSNFELFDSKSSAYGATSGYDLVQQGESVNFGICPTIFGEQVNPGLEKNFEVCFEVPKNNFQYDTLVIYENAVWTSIGDALRITLTENPVEEENLLQNIESTTIDLNSKLYQNNEFSINYPLGWIVDDSQNFENYGVSFFNDDDWTSMIQVFEYQNKDFISKNIEDLKIEEENLCRNSSFDFGGWICYDFEIIDEIVSEDSDGRETIMISYYHVNEYGDEDSSIPYPMISFTMSIIDGNDVWQIISSTEMDEFEFYKEDLTNSFASFKILTDTNALNNSESNFTSNNDIMDETFKVVEEPVAAPQESSEEGGGCLIATATYGSELAPQVQQLRELRDNQLLNTESGTAFMGTFNDIYYSFSPIIADYERENPYFKEAVKLAITPMISSLSLMENAESESEVLGIGISVIMLNLGMYFGVPAIVVVGIRKIKDL